MTVLVEHEHRWRWTGPTLAYEDREWSGQCEHPVLWKCPCGAHRLARCMAHRARRCRWCAARYRQRVARVAEAGANTRGRYGYLLTLTAPSASPHRRWRPNGRGSAHRPVCGCSGALRLAQHEGDEQRALGAWNRAAGRRWNHLVTGLRRLTDLEFFRTVEVQQRGALHAHVLVLSVLPLAAETVQHLALAAGWGCVLDLAVLDPGRHARYVAKYVSKSCDERDDLPWLEDVLDEVTGEVRAVWSRPTFRAWSSSRGWGLTMAALVLRVRERMRRQAVAEGRDDVLVTLGAKRPAGGRHPAGGP